MTAATRTREFTGRHMVIWVVSFFAVIIAVNLTMAWFANSTWSGLIVKNGYVASQNFDEDMARAKAQEALGWTVAVTHDGRNITVRFTGDNAKLDGLTVLGQLRRPATGKFDQALAFSRTGPGLYAAPMKLQPGVWEIEVEAAGKAGEAYEKTFRFFVKG